MKELSLHAWRSLGLWLCVGFVLAWLPEDVSADAGTEILLLPVTQLYPVNIADPRRINFSAKTLFFDYTTIADASRRRFDLKLGGRLGLLRIHPSGNTERGWQVSLDAGFHGQFDADQSEDNIGWDGIYALIGSYRPNQYLAYKFGMYHISSHIGDEIAERTGRQRINYTREEFQIGINWSFTEHWQTYIETAYGYDRRNLALQEPWRAQLGLQFESDKSLWQDQLGLYAALDIAATEERNWNVDKTVQAGLVFVQGQRRWRLGIEYYDGRSQLGEFFQDDERYTGIGLWIDI